MLAFWIEVVLFGKEDIEMKNILPGWEIIEKIGSGGFSTVYRIKKCDSAGDGEYYAALKIITIPHSPEEYENYVQDGYDDETITTIFSNQVKKLEEEFRLMARFKGNSNIVSYEDHMIIPHEDEKGWDILIRMELLDPLTKYCSKKILSVEETVKLGIDICRALELCKKENIIHRDIKPQNIFVNNYGDYKLGDFGIARTMEHATHATRTGTYTYMAPEVYHGSVYDSSVDIYSLGLVLYWLLNERRLPFLPLPPISPTSNQIDESASRRISGEKIPFPKNGNDDLKRIVLKACSFKSEDRYSSATEMKEELEEILISLKKKNKKSDDLFANYETKSNNEYDYTQTLVLDDNYDILRKKNDFSLSSERALGDETNSVNYSGVSKNQSEIPYGEKYDNLKSSKEIPHSVNNKNEYSNNRNYDNYFNNHEIDNQTEKVYQSGSTKSNPKKTLKTVLILEFLAVITVVFAILGIAIFIFKGCESSSDDVVKSSDDNQESIFIGDTVALETYGQDNIISNGTECKEWIVL